MFCMFIFVASEGSESTWKIIPIVPYLFQWAKNGRQEMVKKSKKVKLESWGFAN